MFLDFADGETSFCELLTHRYRWGTCLFPLTSAPTAKYPNVRVILLPVTIASRISTFLFLLFVFLFLWLIFFLALITIFSLIFLLFLYLFLFLFNIVLHFLVVPCVILLRCALLLLFLFLLLLHLAIVSHFGFTGILQLFDFFLLSFNLSSLRTFNHY